LRKRSNPADASAAAAKVICFIVILASCIDTSNACHYDAVDLISVSLALVRAGEAAEPGHEGFGLLLHLLLHLHEDVLRLLEVVRHQALHHRRL
uniref:hypothetical protein n=1 Tax=Escherichia coli TaxID=562 RepID=UPI00197FF109